MTENDETVEQGSTSAPEVVTANNVGTFIDVLDALRMFSVKRFLMGLMIVGGTFWCAKIFLDAAIAAGDLSSASTVIVALLGIMGTVTAFYFGTHQQQQTQPGTSE